MWAERHWPNDTGRTLARPQEQAHRLATEPSFHVNDPSTSYDALLLVSFGGPECPADVIPFLENVLRGRNVPRSRLEEVAEHYYRFDGRSPLNEQNRQLIASLEAEFAEHGLQLPIYWGNRNWHPMLPDTIRQMHNDGVRRALAFVTSAYSSYSGCRQYREDIARACEEVGEHAPEFDKLRVFFNHPGFIEPMAESLAGELHRIPEQHRDRCLVLFTAHSIPAAMAAGCRYEEQLQETCRLLSTTAGLKNWELVYQSRSGPPQQPWLEPDVCDAIRDHHAQRPLTHLLILPVGFISDHMEVLFDLDTEAREVCQALGIELFRVATVGTHPKFVSMIRELVLERIESGTRRRALGNLGPSHDVCPADCCLYPTARPATRPPA